MDLFSPSATRPSGPRPPRASLFSPPPTGAASSSAAAVSNSSSAAAVPLEYSSATTASVGTSAVRPGRPILNTVTNIHRKIEPLMVPVPSRSAASLPTLSVVPLYETTAFYATLPTLENCGAENNPEGAHRLGITSNDLRRLYTHPNPELKNTVFIKVNKPYFKPNRFYPRDTINEGSYFHEGYTFDQIIQMEKERKQRHSDTHYRTKKSGGRRSSRYHKRQSKKQHGRKRTTRRR